MRSLNASGNFVMEHLQRAVSSTVTLSVTVAVAVLLTIITITYQPSDPMFETSKTMEKVFTSVTNSTFEQEGQVLVTGEDTLSPTPSQAPVEIISSEVTNNTPAVTAGACDPGTSSINCSDPGVLVAIELANLKKFPDMGMFRYGKPVRGSGSSKCDVFWSFRAKNDRSARVYRDYREYKLIVNSSCDYQVEKIGHWHSGKNARFHRPEVVNDTIANRSVNSFWKNKYLYYSRGGDYCKSMNQYLWSMLCALGEARYLNRTFVLDLDVCLSKEYTRSDTDEPGKDFRYYFDYEHLQEGTSVVNQKQFLKRWAMWNKKHPNNQVDYRVVDDFKVTPMQLSEERSTILWRKFEKQEPDNYWYRVCEGEAENFIHRPWNLVWKSKRIMNIVNSICGEMEWDFDAVHVVRGKKAENKKLWPNLDRDTMPEAILEKLDGVIDGRRRLYIATNEVLDGYFDKLRAKYQVKMLDDFKDLWAKGSLWYNETMVLTRNKPVSFDGFMRAEVDSEVFLRAKKRVETFSELTKDCKYGVNTC